MITVLLVSENAELERELAAKLHSDFPRLNFRRAPTPIEAVKIAQIQLPDLLLIDQRRHLDAALEFIGSLRAGAQKSPAVLLLSDKAPLEEDRTLLAKGVDCIIAKTPDLADEVLAQVQAIRGHIGT